MHELPSSLLEPASVSTMNITADTSETSQGVRIRACCRSVLDKTLADDSYFDLQARHVEPAATASSTLPSSTTSRRVSPTASELVSASVATAAADATANTNTASSTAEPRKSRQSRPRRRRSASSLGCLRTAIHRTSLATRLSDISVDDDLLALAAGAATGADIGSSSRSPPSSSQDTTTSNFVEVLVEAIGVSDGTALTCPTTKPAKSPNIRHKSTGSSSLKGAISVLTAYQSQQLSDYRRLCAVARSRPSSGAAAITTYLEQCAQEGIEAELAQPAQEACRRLEEYYWNDGIARADRASALAANPVKKGGSDGGPDGSHRRVQGDNNNNSNNSNNNQGPSKITLPPSMAARAQSLQDNLKRDTVDILRNAGGDSTNPRFASSLKVLSSIYKGRGCDARSTAASRLKPGSSSCHDDSNHEHTTNEPDASSSASPSNAPSTSNVPVQAKIEGQWDLLSRPTYPDCLGRDEDGHFLYTLSRMSFGMLSPGDALCSIQRIAHDISLVCHRRQHHPSASGKAAVDSIDMPDAVPRKLREALKSGSPRLHGLRKYDTVVYITIEPPRKRHSRPEDDDGGLPPSRVQAIMTSRGYMLPDESVENRFSVWFTGGSLRPAEGVDTQAWSDIFGRGTDRRRKLSDRAKVMAAKLLLGAEIPHGMEADGSMTYHFHRPLPGHLDVMYTDDTLQVLKGNRGSVMVHSRGETTQSSAATHGAPRPTDGLVRPKKNRSKTGPAARIA